MRECDIIYLFIHISHFYSIGYRNEERYLQKKQANDKITIFEKFYDEKRKNIDNLVLL